MSAYDEILASSNIKNILDYYGLRIEKNRCTCPFHNDSHPSMMINENKGIAKCFACGSGGNSVSFIQKYESEINHNQITIVDAMKKAIEIQHLNITLQENNIPLSEEQKKKKRLSDILKDAINFTENVIKINNIDSKNALEYLKNRKLSLNTINNFHIGFNPNYNNITNELLKKYSLKDLIEVGLTKENQSSYSDMFSNRIVIPIFDPYGNPVGFGARVLDNEIKPKYLNTKETTLFNKSQLLFNYHKAKNYARDYEMIVVEGYMDVISANEIGFQNTVGIMGTALTKEQIELVKKLNCEVTLSLDNDEAGKNAMLRLIPDLLNEKIEVNVLDISNLNGNYKDFGDLQLAGIKREDIYKTKISAFIFLLENKYLKDKKLDVNTISKLFKNMKKDNVIKDTKDIFLFREYVVNNTNLKNEEVDQIIMPKKLEKESRVDRYKNMFFYSFIISHLKSYAEKHEDRILQKYLETNPLDERTIDETFDNENYLKDNENTIDITKYVTEYIYKSEDFIKFKENKNFILEKLLDNVKSFDSTGKIVNIKLTSEQKDMILKQYDDSFDNSIKELIENNPEEYEDLFIANSSNQFAKLFPKSYVETMKEQSIERFKSENVMEAVRYALAYKEDMKDALSSQYVKNGKFKTLLVFNNNKNVLGLTQENIIEKTPKKEKEQVTEKENVEEKVVEDNKQKGMSVFIKLTGEEKESPKGMYLPVNNGLQVFIPKQLYRKEDDKMQIISSRANTANMSEYSIDEESKIKKWQSRLSLDDFYHKYFNLYEISRDKELVQSASY